MNEYIVLDLEATGLHPESGDVIIDIAAIRCNKTGIVDTFQSLVHPGEVQVPDFIYTLTGIDPDALSRARSFSEVVDTELRAFLGTEPLPIIGHNIGFDANFLNVYGFDIQGGQLLDTNDFAVLMYPDVSSHSLEILSDVFSFTHEEKHTALSDVHATYQLLQLLKTKYHRDFEGTYDDSIKNFIKKVPHWGGAHFFSLEMPLLDRLPEVKKSTFFTEHDEKGRITEDVKAMLSESLLDETEVFYSVPSYVQSEDVLIATIKKKLSLLKEENESCTILIQGTDFAKYREAVNSHEVEDDFLLFDGDQNFLVKRKVDDFLQQDVYEPGMEVFALRFILNPLHNQFSSVGDYKLTHKERAITHLFTLGDHEGDQALFQEYLSRFPVTITTPYQYFFGVKSTYVQNCEHIVITHSDVFEISLLQATKNYFSIDSVNPYILRIEKALQENDGSKHMEILTNMEALLTAVKSQLDSFRKSLSKVGDQFTLHDLEQHKEEIRSLYELIQKGTQAIRTSAEELDPTLKLQIDEQLAALNTRTEIMLLMEDADDYHYYGRIYNNQLTFNKERRSLENEVAHITRKKTWSAMDARYTKGSVQLLPLREYYSIDVDDEAQVLKSALSLRIVSKEDAQLIEQDDVLGMVGFVKKERKTILLCNSISRLDKLFEYFYTSFSSEHFPVVAFGKSGGFSKVSHIFKHTEKGLLIARYQDFFKLDPGTTCDDVLIHSLPFPFLQSKYYEEKFSGRTFFDVSLPLCIRALNNVLYKIFDIDPTKTFIYLNDPKVVLKRYGKDIIDGLIIR